MDVGWNRCKQFKESLSKAHWYWLAHSQAVESARLREAQKLREIFKTSACCSFVCVLEKGEIEDLSELRLLLEEHATRKATNTITEEQLKELRKGFDELKAKRVEEHIPEFIALDDRFHSTIYRVAGNRRIEDILLNLKDKIRWVRAVTATLPGRVTESLHEMDKVLYAMERRDPDTAAEAMVRHIGNIATTFKSMPSDAPSGKR